MFNFLIKDDGGESLQFESDSRDVASWERTTKGATMGQLGQDGGVGLSFIALYKIAWFAARRLMLVPRDMTLADFEARYALELQDTEEPKADDEGDESADDTPVE